MAAFRKFVGAILLSVLLVGCSEPTPTSPLEQGKDHFLGGKWDEAIESLTTAISRDPLDAEARVYRGRAYICKGRENTPLAIADYNEAIKLDPENYEAYYNRAIAYRNKGNRRQALADEMTARRFDPSAKRAGAMRPPTPEEVEQVTGRGRNSSADSEPNESAVAEDAVDPTAPAIENLPIPGKSRDVESSDTALDLPSRRGGDSSADGNSDSASDAPTQDAFGLPTGAAGSRSGKTLTEEILGLDANGSRSGTFGEGIATPRFSQPIRPDWSATPAEPLTLPSGRRAPKYSPVGRLPEWGLPFQQPGSSPYGGGGPSTGFRNGLPSNSSYGPPSVGVPGSGGYGPSGYGGATAPSRYSSPYSRPNSGPPVSRPPGDRY